MAEVKFKPVMDEREVNAYMNIMQNLDKAISDTGFLQIRSAHWGILKSMYDNKIQGIYDDMRAVKEQVKDLFF